MRFRRHDYRRDPNRTPRFNGNLKFCLCGTEVIIELGEPVLAFPSRLHDFEMVGVQYK